MVVVDAEAERLQLMIVLSETEVRILGWRIQKMGVRVRVWNWCKPYPT